MWLPMILTFYFSKKKNQNPIFSVQISNNIWKIILVKDY